MEYLGNTCNICLSINHLTGCLAFFPDFCFYLWILYMSGVLIQFTLHSLPSSSFPTSSHHFPLPTSCALSKDPLMVFLHIQGYRTTYWSVVGHSGAASWQKISPPNHSLLHPSAVNSSSAKGSQFVTPVPSMLSLYWLDHVQDFFSSSSCFEMSSDRIC